MHVYFVCVWAGECICTMYCGGCECSCTLCNVVVHVRFVLLRVHVYLCVRWCECICGCECRCTLYCCVACVLCTVLVMSAGVLCNVVVHVYFVLFC